MSFEPVLLGKILDLSRCPHCSVDKPNLILQSELMTADCEGESTRCWRMYVCSRCGGVVTAWAEGPNQLVGAIFPEARGVDEAIPDRPRSFLEQSIESLHAPAGAVMLAASSVDWMLKSKGYRDGSLYARIDKAAKDHLITDEMALWAHDVRLDANDQRHADEEADLPTEQDAERCIAFVEALGEFLFVLPSRIQRGRETLQEV